MSRKDRTHIAIHVEAELMDRIDDWLDQQVVAPSFTAAVVYMIEEFLAGEERRKATRKIRQVGS